MALSPLPPLARGLCPPPTSPRLLRLGDRPGFVVEDLVDLAEVAPAPGTEVPDAHLYAGTAPQCGDEYADQGPAEMDPQVGERRLAPGRSSSSRKPGFERVTAGSESGFRLGVHDRAHLRRPGRRLGRAAACTRLRLSGRRQDDSPEVSRVQMGRLDPAHAEPVQPQVVLP